MSSVVQPRPKPCGCHRCHSVKHAIGKCKKANRKYYFHGCPVALASGNPCGPLKAKVAQEVFPPSSGTASVPRTAHLSKAPGVSVPDRLPLLRLLDLSAGASSPVTNAVVSRGLGAGAFRPVDFLAAGRVDLLDDGTSSMLLRLALPGSVCVLEMLVGSSCYGVVPLTCPLWRICGCTFT